MSELVGKELLEKLRSMKSFNLDDSFELFFYEQLLIPYSAVDGVARQYPRYGGDAIYMIFQADRPELTDICLERDPPAIEYRNMATKQTHRLENLWFFPHPVRRDALHMKIISSTQIEVGINERWRAREPAFLEYTPVSIGLHDLITQSRREFESVCEYDILYIGSSKNVYRRLTNHETILKIYRDMAVAAPNKELFVWLLKPKAKLYKRNVSKYTSLLASSSLWPKSGELGIDVGPEALLLIAEAMLINYFKPEYNDQYVNSMPNLSHAIYKKLHNAGVKYVQVDLNLFMQTYKDVLAIKTGT